MIKPIPKGSKSFEFQFSAYQVYLPRFAEGKGCKILLMHLRYQHQLETRSSVWIATIAEHRPQLKQAFESPSFQPYLVAQRFKAFPETRNLFSSL